MHEIMFALGDLPKIIFKVHFVAGSTLKSTADYAEVILPNAYA